MNLKDIKSLTLSLMKRETDPNKYHQAEYTKKVTAKFLIPDNFPRTEDAFEAIVTDMYNDLQKNALDDIDSIGIWVEYESITVDNAILISVLDDIQEYSKEDVNPIWEFFKMSIPN